MDLKEFQAWAITKKASDLTDREAKLTWALGLVDEAVEVVELLFQEPQNHLALLDELGDMAWYAVIMADAYLISAIHIIPTPRGPYFSVDTIWQLTFAAKEVGELVKKNISHGHAISEPELADQLSLVLGEVFGLAEGLGYSVSSFLQMNRDKLDGRYPGGFSAEASKRR